MERASVEKPPRPPGMSGHSVLLPWHQHLFSNKTVIMLNMQDTTYIKKINFLDRFCKIFLNDVSLTCVNVSCICGLFL